MLQEIDLYFCGFELYNCGDFVGVLWEGCSFELNLYVVDDGFVDLVLLVVLLCFCVGEGSQFEVVDVFCVVCVLVFFIVEKGEEGIVFNGFVVDKMQEFFIVMVVVLDGWCVQLVFLLVQVMQVWDLLV